MSIPLADCRLLATVELKPKRKLSKAVLATEKVEPFLGLALRFAALSNAFFHTVLIYTIPNDYKEAVLVAISSTLNTLEAISLAPVEPPRCMVCASLQASVRGIQLPDWGIEASTVGSRPNIFDLTFIDDADRGHALLAFWPRDGVRMIAESPGIAGDCRGLSRESKTLWYAGIPTSAERC